MITSKNATALPAMNVSYFINGEYTIVTVRPELKCLQEKYNYYCTEKAFNNLTPAGY
jgi:hypothetical protein